MNKNYLWFTIFGYIILISGTIGLIWGYALSINVIKKKIIEFRRRAGVRFKLLYWFLNMLFWITSLAIIMCYYFFTLWYVMNPDAIKNNIIYPLYMYDKHNLVNTSNDIVPNTSYKSNNIITSIGI
jgi:hypothetical protein